MTEVDLGQLSREEDEDFNFGCLMCLNFDISTSYTVRALYVLYCTVM